IKAEEVFLRRLFHDWDPIVSGMPPHTPLDEYDYLVHKIISGLHADITYDGLLKLISDHLCVKVPKQELIESAKEIWSWWCNKNCSERT
ncbi:MAG: hypothetical protein ACYSOT_02090, partial [Planctomycetota bacterium]